MKAFTDVASYEEAVFLVKQQVVYLEKMIKTLKAEQEVCSLAFLKSSKWECQKHSDTFSLELCSQINQLRCRLEKEFENTDNPNSRVEVRFFDLDVLSLLFVHASEAEAASFCRKLKQNYECSYCGVLEYQNIGPELYELAYRAFLFGQREEAGRRMVQVGLSYQQNYLVEVVSSDRGEAKEDLLKEAADQIIAKYHRVIDYE